jgi:DNA-binding MarR family transcriptional regulator
MSTATAVKIPTGEPVPGGQPNGRSDGTKAPDGEHAANGKPAVGEEPAVNGEQATGGAPAVNGKQTLSEGELRALRGLMRAHASLAKRLDAELEAAHALPLSSYEVLHHLESAPEGRMRMCDLAEHAQLSRSGLTRLVDRLERDGLLTRCTCEHDARGAYACLTEQGMQRLGEARGTHLAVVREQFLSRFSEPELGALAEMWDRIAPCCGC